ncbi:putative MFS family arabinose efflux permease [Pseudonocardia autotrophica]|uniref:MFS transporter n=2 Tax=Pseudonocardia TaxID=1847 RepID=A0ABQ0S8F7_9PSEU|nr:MULTISPECIES: MFS transporter [Pseudonocardia]OSY34745.1 putative multidrug-efflux transporter [Pseudonocardia autotrophica]TDN65423.1 putative MFS family arabinose efflux permease [Pseudonocardia autotrophica]BBG05848.1 MFS transporter [Pseudonocardia autotrophica]GEC29190.1 MFS transporter [Pseudonocardia saturnea]
MSDPAPRIGLRTVFAQRRYRRLWSARTVSQCGDVFATVALALLVFDLTGSALGVSAVVFAEILPVLLLAPLAGTIVDRLPRVAVMVAADLWRAVLAVALIVLGDNVAAVYVIAFGLSLGAVFFNPAANSVLPALVRDDELVAANSGVWTAAVLSQIALAPLAGVLYAALGAGAAFGINAASFVLSAVLLAGLRVPAAVRSTERRGFFADAIAGLRVLGTDRLLRALGAGQLLAALSAGATSALLVVLAREHFELPPSGYGFLLGAIGVGAELGPLVLTRLVSNPRRPAFVFGPYVVRGVVDVVLATFATLPVALVALAVYGLGTSSGAVTFNSLLQAHTPEHLRGRIFASFDVFWQLGRLVSLLVGGLLAVAIGIQAVYYLGGALLLLAAVIGWTAMRTGANSTSGT